MSLSRAYRRNGDLAAARGPSCLFVAKTDRVRNPSPSVMKSERKSCRGGMRCPQRVVRLRRRSGGDGGSERLGSTHSTRMVMATKIIFLGVTPSAVVGQPARPKRFDPPASSALKPPPPFHENSRHRHWRLGGQGRAGGDPDRPAPRGTLSDSDP